MRAQTAEESVTQNVEQEFLARIKVLHDTVWEGHASGPAVQQWLGNFTCPPDAPDERLHALCLLSQFMYFGSRQMRVLLKALYRDKYKYPIVEQIRRANEDTLDVPFIQAQFQQTLDATRFLGIGNPSESGVHLLYYFRQENQLRKKYFINAHEIFSAEADKRILRFPQVTRYVFIDDFCGSGSQGKRYSTDILAELKKLSPTSIVSYHVLFATSDGLNSLRSDTLFDAVECIYELDSTFKCFGSNSRYFKTTPVEGINKTEAEKMCRKYGAQLDNANPLGFGDCQLLIGFHHNTPNNTLPIIWFDEPGGPPWTPIFRRYSKYFGWGK